MKTKTTSSLLAGAGILLLGGACRLAGDAAVVEPRAVLTGSGDPVRWSSPVPVYALVVAADTYASDGWSCPPAERRARQAEARLRAAGIPGERICYLRGPEVTKERVQDHLHELTRLTRARGARLVVYWSGLAVGGSGKLARLLTFGARQQGGELSDAVSTTELTDWLSSASDQSRSAAVAIDVWLPPGLAMGASRAEEKITDWRDEASYIRFRVRVHAAPDDGNDDSLEGLVSGLGISRDEGATVGNNVAVVDADSKAPVRGARIEWTPGTISRARPGQHVLRVSAAGYLTRVERIDLRAADVDRTLTVPLARDRIAVCGSVSGGPGARIAFRRLNRDGVMEEVDTTVTDACGAFSLRVDDLGPGWDLQVTRPGEEHGIAIPVPPERFVRAVHVADSPYVSMRVLDFGRLRLESGAMVSDLLPVSDAAARGDLALRAIDLDHATLSYRDALRDPLPPSEQRRVADLLAHVGDLRRLLVDASPTSWVVERTVFVGAGPGCDFADLQAALDSVPPFTSIVLRGERFAGVHTVRTTVEILAVGTAEIEGLQRRITRRPPLLHAGRGPVLTIEAPGVRLCGIRLRCTEALGDQPALSIRAQDVELMAVECEGGGIQVRGAAAKASLTTCAVTNADVGLTVEAGASCEAVACSFEQCRAAGIRVDEAHGMRLVGGEIRGARGAGLMIGLADSVVAASVTIVGSGDTGCEVRRGGRLELWECSIVDTGAGTGLLVRRGGEATIRGGQYRMNGDFGIDAEPGSACRRDAAAVVRGNHMRTPAPAGGSSEERGVRLAPANETWPVERQL